MRRRKEGFSLVELLIVLAVMAALIATITPVALNAIRKAKATRVGQDMKALASSFENYLYVNGEAPTSISELGRDIDTSQYAVGYNALDTGTYQVTVAASADVNQNELQEIIPTIDTSASESSYAEWIDAQIDGCNFFYNFEFQVY